MIDRQNLVERLLYIALLMIFVGVCIAIYVALSFGMRLDKQVQELQRLNQGQAETIRQIKVGVEQLKQNNQQNTNYLQCLLEAHDVKTPLNDSSCQQYLPPASSVAPVQPAQGVQSFSAATAPTKTPAPSTPRQNSPQPSPRPSITQNVGHGVSGILKALKESLP